MNSQIGIIYASMSGRNEQISKYLEQQFIKLGQSIDRHEISQFETEKLSDYQAFIIVSYTYHDGQIPDEALDFFDDLQTVDLTGKPYTLTGSSSMKHEHFGRALDYLDQQLVHLGALRASAILKINEDADRADLARLDALCQQVIDFNQLRTQHLV
ncbi:MAG TPA: flavodoxin domain-containing protein [Lapidilactobacillus dextrinicus]|uniref:Flavodoxin domain-containing protein n=1 Tax=Lapidilactobacillus dextrinicus TaxID=51664 RepID=A0A921B3F7_9LACO|nr:flavodoxin domain-containing protein [Lapidilactobacillus dextrinicus]